MSSTSENSGDKRTVVHRGGLGFGFSVAIGWCLGIVVFFSLILPFIGWVGDRAREQSIPVPPLNYPKAYQHSGVSQSGDIQVPGFHVIHERY